MPATGIHTVTVPGAVAGWAALRERFGTLSLADLLAPAIHYAEEGFPVTEVVARGWENCADRLWTHPNTAKTYLVGGRPPQVGEIFRNADLAASLRRVAESGRDGFYRGTTAQAILQLSAELGGTLTAEDLEQLRTGMGRTDQHTAIGAGRSRKFLQTAPGLLHS